jgi:hypothetical protein
MSHLYEIVTLVISVVVDLALAIGIVFFSARIFSRFIKSTRNGFLQAGNVAAAILFAAVIFSEGLLGSAALSVAQQNLQMVPRIPADRRLNYILSTVSLGILQTIVAAALALGIAFLSLRLYDRLTVGLNEVEEVAQSRNVAVGIILAALVVCLSLFIKTPFTALLDYLIPLPAFAIPM